MSGLAIDVRGLRKVWRAQGRDVVAVDGLDLSVARGEVFGLLGPNGAGKTTTVEICEGLVRPTSGEVEILGRRWADDPTGIRARIGVSLQETRLFDKQTVRELCSLFAAFYPDPRPVDEVIALVGLGEKADSRYGQLSGGQKQRLAVATALAGRPELLFLDEPTTGLDPQSRRQLWEVVRAFRAGGGSVLLTTHYMDEAHALCDRLMIVDHGRSIALGSPRELIDRLGPGHVVEIEGVGLGAHRDRLAAVAGVTAAESAGDRLTLRVEALHRAVPDLLRVTASVGVDVEHLETRHTTLEDVFVHLTGRQLRDGDVVAEDAVEGRATGA